MDPGSIYMAVKAVVSTGGQVLKAADAKVAACAEEQAITKEEAWEGVRAEVRRRNDGTLERLLDLGDPLGWRAAAQAMQQAERDKLPAGTRPDMVGQDRQPPWKCLMHYDPTVQGVWIGSGVDLHPACGQPEHIGVTDRAEAVECLKCLHIMERSTT